MDDHHRPLPSVFRAAPEKFAIFCFTERERLDRMPPSCVGLFLGLGNGDR
jgi:hypothetical protein